MNNGELFFSSCQPTKQLLDLVEFILSDEELPGLTYLTPETAVFYGGRIVVLGNLIRFVTTNFEKTGEWDEVLDIIQGKPNMCTEFNMPISNIMMLTASDLEEAGVTNSNCKTSGG